MLVGAVTLLVSIVAVFLSYNANSGLPFVPTYDAEASCRTRPTSCAGNEVRIGGARVGVVTRSTPVPATAARRTPSSTLKLDKDLDPLPVDSTFIVRPRSALGLKYVELDAGQSAARASRRAPRCRSSQATPDPVEIDEVFNMFDARTRRGFQQSLDGFGTGLAGRGR